MTVPTNTSFVTPRPAGNSITTVFNFPFKVLDATDVVAGFVDGNGVYTPQVNGLDFVVSGVDVNTGGAITFTIPPPFGYSVDIRSQTSGETAPQPTALTNQGKYLANSVEDAFDRITRIVQDLSRQTYTFGIHGPDTELTPWPALPPPSARANTGIVFDGNGNLSVGVIPTSTVTQAVLGALLSPPFASEGTLVTQPWYELGNLLRYGLVPNAPTAASANTTILQTLLDPTRTGSTGRVYSPNTTGADIYYFNDVVPIRDGIALDLCGASWQFNKSTTDAHDTNAGFLFAVRDFSIHGGSVVVNYTGTGPVGAIALGARDNEAGQGAYFQGSYDASLPVPQGNIHVYDLRVQTNATLGYGFLMTGGLDTVLIENVIVDGQSKAVSALDYEFGFATDGGGVGSARVSSHMKNFTLKNFKVFNVTGAALGIRGAYNFLLENICVNGAANVVALSTGEAGFFQVWSQDIGGKKTTKRLINIQGQNLTATGISLDGTVNASGTYLGDGLDGAAVFSNPPLSAAALAAAKRNLGYFTLDGFTIGGTSAGTGIELSGATQDVRNGTVSGFGVGVFSYAECDMINLVNVKSAGNHQDGFQLGRLNQQSGDAYTATKITMRNCVAINNSLASAGTSPGISIYNNDSAVIENCRVNSEIAFGDAADETTQGNGIQLDPSANNVVCRNNRVGVVFGGNFAYYNGDTSPPNSGHVVSGASGVTTMHGLWGDGISDNRTLTYGTSMTMDASISSDYTVTLTNNTAFTINAPTNPRYGQHLTLTIRANTSAPGAATFNAIFKMSAWTQPANQQCRSITWRWDNANWVQIAQTGVDVPL